MRKKDLLGAGEEKTEGELRVFRGGELGKEGKRRGKGAKVESEEATGPRKEFERAEDRMPGEKARAWKKFVGLGKENLSEKRGSWEQRGETGKGRAWERIWGKLGG